MNQKFAKACGLILGAAFVQFGLLNVLNAQICPEGQTAMSLEIHTDAWGYESYWAIVPNNMLCADSLIFEGGNIEDVGCNGDGDVQGGNGYDSNIIVVEDSLCAATGDTLHLVHIDSYGDGGLFFELFFEGILAGTYVGTGYGNDWSFVVGELSAPAYDSPCGALPIEVNGDTLVLETGECMAAFGEPSPPVSAVYSCQIGGAWCESGLSETAWLSFVAQEGNCEVNLCHDSTDFDTQVALWKADDCGDFSTYELLSANDDLPGGCGPGAYYASRMWTGCLEVGETYLIQIDGWQGSDGTVAVSVASSAAEAELSAVTGGLQCAIGDGEDPSGYVVLNMTGSGSDYDVAWIGPDGFDSDDWQLTGLNFGTYSALISTSCGSVMSYSVTFDEVEELVSNLQFEGPGCPESMDGWASIDASGGAGQYQYAWTGPDGELGDAMALEGLDVGAYEVSVVDANGCSVSIDFELVEQGDALSFSLGADTTICNNETLLLYAPAGLSYEWSTGSVDQFIVVDGQALGAGTYSYVLTASNEVGCSYADAIFVTVFDCTDGVGELGGSAALKVGPNPTADAWTVELVGLTNTTGLAASAGVSKTNWCLLDAVGRRVASGIAVSSTWTVPAARIAPGSYQLHVELADGKRAVQHLVRR